jgi:hypothetical protein
VKEGFNHREHSAAEPQPKIGISRAKDAKAAKKKMFSELGVLGVLARE